MSEQHSLQNIWAMADKPIIDIMSRKTPHTPSACTVNDSNDLNSDSESVASSSYGAFVAVPKEFRPPLSICTKIEKIKISQPSNKEISSKPKPNSVSTNAAQNISKTSLLENPKPELREYKKETNTFVKHIKPPVSLQKTHHAVNNATSNIQNETNMESNFSANRKTYPSKMVANNASQKPNTITYKENLKYENGKHKIRYEYVETKQTQGTMDLKSENPLKLSSKRDDLKTNLLKEENQKRVFDDTNKNFLSTAEHFYKDSDTLSYKQNTIQWKSSLNKKDKTSSSTNILKQDSDKDAHKLFNDENIVKWNSSLNLDSRITHQENSIKWCNFSKQDELSSDTENEIEWTIIREKKTIISAHKNHTQNQINKKYQPTIACTQKKPRKWYRKKNFNSNLKSRAIDPKKNAHGPHLPDDKDTNNLLNKNDPQLNNNIKSENVQKDSSLNVETFTQQNIGNTKKSENLVNSNLLNENSETMTSSSMKKEINNCESYINQNILENQKKCMLHYSSEMSDLLIGSYDALSLFISMFDEWKRLRLELIGHFEYLEKNLKESSKTFVKYKDMLNIVNTGTRVAAAIPLPHVSVAAKVIGLFTTLFSAFLNKTEQQKAKVDDPNDITLAASKDSNASADMYIYGLQCGQNFEETSKLIEEFHSKAGDPTIFNSDSPEIATFLRGFLEYKPKHRVFFKKLYKCFQELLQNSRSEFSRRFCEPFLLHSSRVIDIIGLLDWRFRHEDFNSESVRFELEHIQNLIGNKDTSIKELTVSVQNCIRILDDELKYLEGCIRNITLFNNLMQIENRIF